MSRTVIRRDEDEGRLAESSNAAVQALQCYRGASKMLHHIRTSAKFVPETAAL